MDGNLLGEVIRGFVVVALRVVGDHERRALGELTSSGGSRVEREHLAGFETVTRYRGHDLVSDFDSVPMSLGSGGWGGNLLGKRIRGFVVVAVPNS